MNAEKYRWARLSAIFGLVLALAACSADGESSSPSATAGAGGTLAKIESAGAVDVALAANPPYSELAPDGSADGYAPALARAILSDLGVDQLNPSLAEFQGLIPGLEAGRWDVITTGLSITPERCESILFSEPTVVQQETLTVVAGNPLGITSHDYFLENPDAVLAVLTGSSQQAYAVEQAGIPESQILPVSDSPGLADALLSGRADAFAIGQVSAQTATAPYEGEVEIILLDYIPKYGTGFGFRMEDSDVRDYFNQRMAALHDSGEFQELYEEWGFTNYDVLAETTLNDLVEGCQ